MNRWLKLLNFFLAGMLLVFVMYGIQSARASGDELTNISKNTNIATGGDARNFGDINGGSNSYSSDALGLGFSYALGDVDLNEGRNCYVSTAWGSIIFGKQTVGLNPWCAALFYDANRMHEFAAKQRCQLPSIISEYDTKAACVLDQTLAPIEVVNSPKLDAVVAQYQEEEEEREANYAAIQQQLAEFVEEKKKSDATAARYVAQRRAEEQEDRLYAQQLIEEIRQIEEPPK